MIIHRHLFFLVLFALIIVPPVTIKLIWLAQSQKTKGIFYFEGHGNALEQMRSSYSLIFFKLGKDTVWFEGPGGMRLKENATVAVRYNKHHPADAKVDNFLSIWGAMPFYGGIPVVMLLVLFLHPHIIPYRARLRLNLKSPFIWLVDGA